MTTAVTETSGEDRFVTHHEEEQIVSNSGHWDENSPVKNEESQAMQEHRATVGRFSPQDQKRIIQRIDWRIMPIVGAMFCICLLDRANLGAANIAGMAQELGLNEGMRYSIITLVFFPTYIVFEIPATLLIRWVSPRLFLSSVVMTWAVILIGAGFAHEWQVIAGLRAILGILEAGFFPGCLYFLSTWYTRYEMHKRYSMWYFIASTLTSCGGILAYGLMQMHGTAGLAGWRWIFIMEGVITAAVGLAGYVFLVGFPESKKRYRYFLSDAEVSFVLARINLDRNDAEITSFNLREFLLHTFDLKLWLFGLIYCFTLVVGYSFAYFLPIILLYKLEFSLAAAQCLVAPPYFLGGLVMLGQGWLGDKYKTRAPIILFNCLLTLVGLPVMTWSRGASSQYVGVFIAVIGANSNIPAAMAYQANNIRGHWKRAFSSATFVALGGVGGVGGIAGALVFRSQDAPTYLPGIYACITTQVLTAMIVIYLSWRFRRDNKAADVGAKVIEGDTAFRYTI
ncbi:uncharacterized protein A1O9_01526 [Exophiala aquamarina CBS 119918]|uniref:Major facilitator superfamily (MFS) profile domain-containing protein n=1 Tax=Exophiala aquamarina CBS 119918 TaxID=1182545 RepID=A0A072PW12_9EURO|nr:uncharacterized protein A1O9_01526 [Exophiala aquamarina CBS 119918]KEF63548.1 hypothetical protein A1O9_01526 [Exophiala aquamarina CBS 119918]